MGSCPFFVRPSVCGYAFSRWNACMAESGRSCMYGLVTTGRYFRDTLISSTPSVKYMEIGTYVRIQEDMYMLPVHT